MSNDDYTNHPRRTPDLRRAELMRLPAAHEMTPVALEVLLAHYYSGGIVALRTDAQHAAALFLQRHHLITSAGDPNGPYTIQERGRAHVLALLKLPLPIARTVWETPQQPTEDA